MCATIFPIVTDIIIFHNFYTITTRKHMLYEEI